jgi:hypothetical protein
MQRRQSADLALGIVGRHFNSTRFSDRSDLLHFQNSAGMTNIRLHEVHQVTGAEIKEAVLCERSLSGGQRDFGLLPQQR